jgi:hypothetical protein
LRHAPPPPRLLALALALLPLPLHRRSKWYTCEGITSAAERDTVRV